MLRVQISGYDPINLVFSVSIITSTSLLAPSLLWNSNPKNKLFYDYLVMLKVGIFNSGRIIWDTGDS